MGSRVLIMPHSSTVSQKVPQNQEEFFESTRHEKVWSM